MARVRTTPAVRFALYALVAYVVLMLLLILVRFLRIFPARPAPAKTSIERVVPVPLARA